MVVSIGWINNIEIHEYLLISDLAVFPGKHSVIWEQAVGCGIPAIFKRIDGHEHIDLGGNCLLIDDGSVEEIKQALISILNDQLLYQKMKKISVRDGRKYFSYMNISSRAIEGEINEIPH